MTTGPAGWYPDPAGGPRSRWWDGSAWTGHVRDDPAWPGALVEPRRTRPWVIAGVAALCVGLLGTIVIGIRNTVSPPGGRQVPLGEVVPGTEVPAPLSPDTVDRALEVAGCRTVADGQPLEDRSHLDPQDAPPPEALYPDRPPHSGRHFGGLLPLPTRVAERPIDERAVLHNMEHGSVVVWLDPVLLSQHLEPISEWWAHRVDLGFTSRAGGALFVSPMPDLDDAPAVALRAWGVAVDCDEFAPLVADAFLVDHWGSHGAAPEANLSPFPSGSLQWADGEGDQ